MRLDSYLVEKGEVESREKGKYLIKKGYILVNGNCVTKASKNIKEGDKVELTRKYEYVGKGGYKIEKPAREFSIRFEGKRVADVGCSVGGFTEFVLKNGASEVVSIDTGDLLNDNLKQKNAVIYYPNTDARELSLNKIDIALIDVTITSLKEIIPVVKSWLKPGGQIIALVKPPFEYEQRIKKVKSDKAYELAQEIAEWSRNYLLKPGNIVLSEVKGKSEQDEYFIYLEKENKQFLRELEKLKELNLPKSKLAVFGSGPLAIRNIREARDVDVLVKENLWEELKKKYKSKDNKTILVDNIEFICEPKPRMEEKDEVIDNAEEFEGIRFAKLEYILKFKRIRDQEKDRKDIRLINEYLEKN